DEKGDIMLDENKYYLWKPIEPRYFEIKLEGKVDDSHPSSLKILRIISVPYDRIAENYKYTPKSETLPSTIKGIRSSLSSSQPTNWGPEISTPGFIIQYSGDWWQFADTGPEK
ncbi:MAG: hypothetical protein Q7R84_02565, partial [bacterium]|nr:hypothetical protein [bacterium]